jgi:ornithine cyclodeaminase/alanine dehydrogenase-like protein (mu-crystallin family)
VARSPGLRGPRPRGAYGRSCPLYKERAVRDHTELASCIDRYLTEGTRHASFNGCARGSIFVIVLSDRDLEGLLAPQALILAVEAAARAQDEGPVRAPPRQHLEWDRNTLLTMPAVSPEVLGVKLVSVVPANANRGLPVTNGIMVLNDRETGLVLALMNAAALTAQRTGAVGALGVRYLTPPDVSSVGIVGCGVQGVWQAIFACAIRPVREIFCLCRSTASFERFSSMLRRYAPHITPTPCKTAHELLARTQVVITATTSSEPVLPDDLSLLEGKHFISIGSFKPTMQELPDAVYRLAGELAIDSEAAREEVGDVINPVRKGMLKETDVFNIAQLVTGKRSVDVTRTTAYKSVGMALYDLYVAQALCAEARRRGIGQQIEL